ncbi:MAG: DUF177 domain-containing protein [Pseudomonadota bacterium]
MHPAPTATRTSLPPTGRTVLMAADAGHRARLAKELGLLDLARFEAELTAERAPADGIRVFGRVSADLVQSCVLTLAELPVSVDEPVDITYSPHAAERMEDGEIVIDAELEGPEPMPDSMDGDTLDLAEIAREHLVLALDPYPKAPGAALDADLATDKEASPFAVLERLKAGDG